jgi:hypothetical protein
VDAVDFFHNNLVTVHSTSCQSVNCIAGLCFLLSQYLSLWVSISHVPLVLFVAPAATVV